MALDQPAHGGPNYQGTIDVDTAFQIARQDVFEMTPDELIRARTLRAAREASDLSLTLSMLVGVQSTPSNEENVRIIEGELAVVRRALDRLTATVTQ